MDRNHTQKNSNVYRWDVIALIVTFGVIQTLVIVNGTMGGKLDAARRAESAMAAGMQVHVLSMMQPDSLKRLLHGKMVGTQIVP
jgi:hypothetical protein